MKTKKKIVLPLIIVGAVVVFLVLFSVSTYGVNVALMSGNMSPLFVFRANGVNDGGTKIYRGLGYHIVEWSRYIDRDDLNNEDIIKALEKAGLSEEEYEEFAVTRPVFVCGWDIVWGYDDRSTIKKGPSSKHTINLHIEFDRL